MKNKVPIIINNMNLLEWPSKMVEQCKKFVDVGDIIIIDNDSTYEPLLEWYKTNPCEIIYSENLGNCAPWILDIPGKRGYDYYVVTDPDLNLSITPLDCLNYIKERLEKYNEFDYIGLSLSNYQQPHNNPYHFHLKTWAYHAWETSMIRDGLLLSQIVDTTFAMYKTGRYHRGNSCATNYPYSTEHLPWNITNEELKNLKNFNFEFYNYLLKAKGVCSYKNFVAFEQNYI